MYTYFREHSGSVRTLYREHREGIVDSRDTEASLTPESREKITKLSDAVIAEFEKNPEKQQEFLNSLGSMKEKIFKDPQAFSMFLEKAYAQEATAISTLEGSEKTKKIEEFSTFATDIMLQFAEFNHIPSLKAEIDARREALERATTTIQSRTHAAEESTRP